MKKSNLRAAAALQALALMGAGVATAFIAVAPAAAQDYTSGSITGTVTDESGNAVSGATVTLLSKSQGFTQTTTSSGNGSFRFGSLTTGDYDVTVKSGTSAPFRAENVKVLAGQTADLNIGLTSATAGGGEIVVMGSKIQAFTGTTTGLNVNVEELTKTIPVGRNLTSVILLAPGTSRGDSAFGNLASVGGSSVAENAYYVNGLNTTNFDNYLGSALVPFTMYKSVEVKSGGYPAEFGRATGGIVNATTKTGTNDFKAAFHIDWAPNFLRSHGPDLLNCSNITTRTPFPNTKSGFVNVVTGQSCSNLTNRHFDTATSLSAQAEVGLPIIRDRLFAYGLLEMRRNESMTINVPGGSAARSRGSDPFWGVKLDAYPIDDQHFELTVFDTRNQTIRDDLAYSELPGGQPVIGAPLVTTAFNGGGLNYVAKYTGRFTDWLTVSGAYGRVRDRFDNLGQSQTANLPRSLNLSGGTLFGVASGGNYNAQRISNRTSPYNTERKFYRGDVDIYASLFGDHHFRAGLDVESNVLAESSVRNGGAYLNSIGLISPAALAASGANGGFRFEFQPADANGNIVTLSYFNTGGSFNAKNDAIYFQDEWKPTDRLTLNLGARRDNFRVDRADGQPYAQLKDNWAPRIGITYDLWSDKRGKLKAFYGQYYLPFASNTAFRNAGSEYFFSEQFYVTGVNSNGIPTFSPLGQVTNRSDFTTACPFKLTTLVTETGNNCSVTGDGTVAPTDAGIAANLKATKEQEWLFGYDHKLGRWNVGVDFTRRKLLITAEDFAIDKAVNAYCAANGIVGCSTVFTGYHQYVIGNPGNDVTVRLDGGSACDPSAPGFIDQRLCDVVSLKGSDMGFPKAKRKYTAVDFHFDRPYDGVWSLGGSYTWSKSIGNTEGYVQSDYGQSDAGITVDFDSIGFTEGAYGLLPNDRRHRFKLYGAYTFLDAFTVGSNFSLQSPRHLGCFGYHPTDPDARTYGAFAHYCNGVLVPRGTGKKTDWIAQLDMKFAYRMKVATGQTMTLRADVFNLFNSSSVEKYNETGDLSYVNATTGVGGTNTGGVAYYVPNPNYGKVGGYQTPRSMRLGLDIEF